AVAEPRLQHILGRGAGQAGMARTTELAATLLAAALLMLGARPGLSGVHYSGESFAELPSKWSGFLVDQRTLRTIAIERPKDMPQSPLREAYLAAAKKLESMPGLSADEAADLGAVEIRLGKVDRALEVLRAASRRHPDHFRIAANLGTVW